MVTNLTFQNIFKQLSRANLNFEKSEVWKAISLFAFKSEYTLCDF